MLIMTSSSVAPFLRCHWTLTTRRGGRPYNLVDILFRRMLYGITIIIHIIIRIGVFRLTGVRWHIPRLLLLRLLGAGRTGAHIIHFIGRWIVRRFGAENSFEEGGPFRGYFSAIIITVIIITIIMVCEGHPLLEPGGRWWDTITATVRVRRAHLMISFFLNFLFLCK
ncbi:hypothetical protein AGDE_15004 [Angomonas deanei]|uniref:Uncharacterized protein n=1 Tax=Angomonas deanei TaxID=59799 RepID=A0A7G2CMN5_9TRYP|nr:hypothetical protein AGDE_15004 [Angomonas deanei]CAD2220204.1 hypothetical protein, conserved [Angomonas deanei]|eukprot:EPY19852.1 hypothetical protein AGDE_15004 [Angomonas deanei]